MEHVSVAFPVKKDFPFQKKRYVKAVTDVSLEIYPGETFGVVGESGHRVRVVGVKTDLG